MKNFYLSIIFLSIFLTLAAETINSYYPSGKLEFTGTMINGKKQGEWKWFFENGKLSLSGKYLADKEVGEWKWFHTNGIAFAVGYFANGKPIGNWKRYNKNGKLLIEKGLKSEDNALSFRKVFGGTFQMMEILFWNVIIQKVKKTAILRGIS
jgi:hypothetical protein